MNTTTNAMPTVRAVQELQRTLGGCHEAEHAFKLITVFGAGTLAACRNAAAELIQDEIDRLERNARGPQRMN